MTTEQNDEAVNMSTLALALEISDYRVTRRYLIGAIPAPDGKFQIFHDRPPIRGWKLSTIHNWNPSAAARCSALLATLANLPPLDAA